LVVADAAHTVKDVDFLSLFVVVVVVANVATSPHNIVSNKDDAKTNFFGRTMQKK
jgi:hypothetical protein